MKKTLIIMILLSTYAFSFSFSDLTDSIVKEAKEVVKMQTGSSSSSLSNETIIKGLKEALNKGVTSAVTILGANNGYLNNAEVKIPLPSNLEKAKVLISKIGGESYIKDLEKAMNNAATQAAPKTAKIFSDSISKMSISDASNILNGADNSATTYFKTNTLESLKTLITPIIKETMAANNVASYYSSFNSFYKENIKSYVDSSSLTSYAKTLGVDSYIPGSSDESLDEYIVNKALDGLFLMIEKEEKRIRENPIERTTQILKDVFTKN